WRSPTRVPHHCLSDDGRRAAFLNPHHATQSDHFRFATPPDRLCPGGAGLSMAVRMGDFTNVPGGFPITVSGEVIGAVAAGGASVEQDVIVAKAALAAVQPPAA